MSKVKTPLAYMLEVIKEQDPKKYEELIKTIKPKQR